ncbi:MAG: hypothetical protein HW404_732 [Anaerolineales bacterium]|nr:hypothetical protein [Anaerolineales bacterium]
MQRPFLILPILLLLSLAAAACAPAATPIAEEPVDAEVSSPAAATLVPSAPAAPTSPPQAAPTEAVFVGAGGQFATDPSTVELAAGRPTLVKFFAFW